ILPTSAEVQRHRDAEQEQAQQQAGGTVAGTGSDQQHTSAAAHARAVPFGTSSPWAAQEEAGTTPALPSIEAALAALHAVPHPLGAGRASGPTPGWSPVNTPPPANRSWPTTPTWPPRPRASGTNRVCTAGTSAPTAP